MFAPAHVLPQTIATFEREYLEPINERAWEDADAFLDHIAAMHAELLFTYPFRDGNGRIIRLFTKLIFLAKSGEELSFDFINQGDNFHRYISAVQQAAGGEYGLMRALFRQLRT